MMKGFLTCFNKLLGYEKEDDRFSFAVHLAKTCGLPERRTHEIN